MDEWVGQLLASLGLVSAAGTTGWFALRAARQNTAAAATKAEVRTLGTEVADALALVAKMVDKDSDQQRVITDLRTRLIACLEGRGTLEPPPPDIMGA